ncbi:UNVERIFIED_CONTAM: hypothetical protein GTU68_026420 [Idotea baltica]|nr:hypothetical protein [Idotea baltica]
MHLRKHSGERPFKCDICDSSFTQKTHLSTHRRIHTGEYPYKCDICGDAFRDGANFWRHKKRHSSDDTDKSKGGSMNSNAEGRIRPPRAKKTKNEDKGKEEVPSTPGFVSGQFVPEGSSVAGLAVEKEFMNKDPNYDHVLTVVKTEAFA